MIQASDPAEEAISNRAAGISIRNLSVEYRSGTSILHDLSVNVQPGEIMALVGASGCGKSTLLRAIAKLIKPVSGEIAFDSGAACLRTGDLAYVFQDATLLPWRTVLENVRLPLELTERTMDRRGTTATMGGDESRRIAEILATVGMERETWSKYPRELSGGMRMRTSIARALVTDPNVLLLDEPFAALDDILRTRLGDLILRLWEMRPRTILFVTHNIAEAVILSHRIGVFGGGRIARLLENRLDWPRGAAQRTSVDFAQQYGVVSQALAEVSEL